MFRKVIKKEPIGLRTLLTMECGHTADAIHPDDEVFCLACNNLADYQKAQLITRKEWQAKFEVIDAAAEEAAFEIDDNPESWQFSFYADGLVCREENDAVIRPDQVREK